MATATRKEYDPTEHYGTDEAPVTHRCDSCAKPSDTVVWTVDGPVCVPCMKTYQSEAEATNDPSFIPVLA